MTFRYIIHAPRSYAGDLEEIALKPDKVSEIYAAAEKGIIKIITDYCKRHNLKLKVFTVDFTGWGPQALDVTYKQMVEYADAAVILTDGESKTAFKMEKLCQAKPIPVKVLHYKSVKQELKEAIQKEKENRPAKRKKIRVPLSKEARQRYIEAHKKWYERQYPNGMKDGFYTAPKMFPIDSGGAMDRFIVKFLQWEGWEDATKVTNIGRKINGKWIASGIKKGTQDVIVTIAGKSVRIESKHCSDTASDKQIEMQNKTRASGGISETVHSIEEFFKKYDMILTGKIS